MIETPRVKELAGTERSAASGHKLEPDEIAKVGPSDYCLKTGLLIPCQVVCIPYGARSECMDSRARLAVRYSIVLSNNWDCN